jgi:lipoprotein-releasing system ATP-binding protein
LNSESAIWADSLTKIYRSGGAEVVVFDDLSLEVSRGERLAIIGESGAGKSTLLHLLGGLDRPSDGKIFFRGPNSAANDIVLFDERRLAQFRNSEIGFVWQNPSLLPDFSALENVMMPLLIRGIPPVQAHAAASEKLLEVGLLARAAHRAGELSGGEQQRVVLARALAAGPSLLLADEPTGSLDFKTGSMIIGLLDDLHAAHGLTSIFVTHTYSFAAHCDRVLQLRKGRLHSVSTRELQEPGVVETRVLDATRPDGGTYV